MPADLAARRLRAGRAYALVGIDNLNPDERYRLLGPSGTADTYGILRPSNPLLPVKVVSNDAALLLLALERPRRVPSLVESMFGDHLAPLRALIADGVIEVEDDEAFVSGPAAQHLLWEAGTTNGTTPTSALSRLAIECAAAYEALDATTLADKVYAFGRSPCTPALRRRLADEGDVLRHLLREPAAADALAFGWPRRPPGAGWLSFCADGSTPRLDYKLYVSPRLEAMPVVFAITLAAMRRARCSRFKVGGDAEGLCRPDKMVAYFESLDSLLECSRFIEAEVLQRDVPPRAAHGVPFTACIDAHGLLSWGMDSPELGRAPVLAGQSWRQWVASRIAVSVLSAKSARASDIIPFVLQRVALEGVDPTTWAPTLSLWSRQASREDVA